jgi:WD40 repeat protein
VSSSKGVGRTPLCLLFSFLILLLEVAPSFAEEITTTPLQFYGLGTLNCAAWSADGTRIVTGGSMGAFLWDAATSRVVRMFVGHSREVVAVAISPDGSLVLTGSADGTARLWNVADGATIHEFPNHNGLPNSVAFSPDGTKVLLALNDRTARTYNVSNGSQAAMFLGHSDDVMCAAFSPDGGWVATGSKDLKARIWNANTGSPIRIIACPNQVTNVVFSPDGTRLITAAVGKKTLTLWNPADGGLFGTISWGNEYGGVTSFAFSPDSQRIFIGTLDGWIFVRPVAGGAEIGFFMAGNAPVGSIVFSPDGKHVLTGIGAPENIPRIWPTNKLPYHVVITGHTARINSVAFSSDGTKVLIGSGYVAKMRNVADGSEVRTFSPAPTDPGQEEVVSVAISPDGTKVLTGHPWPESVVKLWNAVDGTLIRTFYGASMEASPVAFSPDGTKVFAGGASGAILWDASNGTLIRSLFGHSLPLRSARLSPDGTKVLTGSEDYTAKLWNVADGTLIRTFDHGGRVLSVSFSPDGAKVLTAGMYRAPKVWDASSGTLLLTLSGHTDWVDSAVFSSDGTMILTGSWDGTAKLWDSTSGTLLRTFSGHASLILDAVFSPDGTKVLTASGDTTARLYSTGDGTCIRTFSGHPGHISSAAFSPDGNEVLTGSSWASTAHLWDASSGTLIRTFMSRGGNTHYASFSSDGNEILTGTRGGMAGTTVVEYYSGRTNLWSKSSGDLIWTYEAAGPVAYSPAGLFVAHVWNGAAIEILDASSGTLINSIGTGSYPYSVAFSPEGNRIATGSGVVPSEVRIWDVPDGNLIRAFSVPIFEAANSLAFSPDGTRVLAGGYADPTARLWNTLDGTLIRTITPGNPVTEWIGSVAFSPDGTKALLGTCSSYQGLAPGQASGSLWDLSNGSLIRRFQRHTRTVSSVAFSQNGSKMVTASYDGTARIWNMPGAAPSLAGHNRAIIAVAGSADLARVATLHKDNQANVWGGIDGALLRTFSGRTGQIRCAALSSTGTLFVTGEDTTAKLWDLGSSQPIRLFEGHLGAINSVTLSSDTTKLLTAGNDGWAILWRISDGAALQTYFGRDSRIYATAMTPDAGLVVTGGSSSTAHVWNALTGQRYRTFTGHTSSVLCVAISNDGSTLLTGSADKTAKLWNAISGALLHTFTGYTSPVVSVAFSPDGSGVLTASGTSVTLWNASDGTILRTIGRQASRFTGAVVSADGQRVVTGSDDGVARLWPGFGAGSGGGTGGPTLSGDKFILVSGGGEFTGNPIVTQTQALADRAYFTCLVRGYRRDDVRYLSAFSDWTTRDSNGDGLADANGPATLTNFWSAIDTWSSGTARLFVYLIDHGTYNTQTQDWYFMLNPTENINAHDLDAHLDALQAATGCEVIVVVDCCYAGGFVRECAATSGTKRVVIAATTPYDLAVYPQPAGAESFSFIFLSYAILGNNLRDCFQWTRDSIVTMGSPGGQLPWLDDNGDGFSTSSDGALASRHVLGRYPAFGLVAPRIVAVASSQTATLGQPVALWAQMGEAVAVEEVWALVIPRAGTYAPGQPVTNLIRVDLEPSGTPNRWEAVLEAARQPVGEFKVVYYAVSADPQGTRLPATPVASGLTILSNGSAVGFAASSSSVSENAGTAQLLLQLTQTTTWPVTVNYAVGGTATPSVDFAALSGHATIDAGHTTASIPVAIINDLMDEPDETVQVTLTNATGAVLGAMTIHTLTILDNDGSPTVGFDRAAQSVLENGTSVSLRIRLSAASGKTVTVNYATVNGTALGGSDYVTTSGVVSFAPGETQKTVRVRIIDDSIYEGNETFSVRLSNAANATVGTGTEIITIIENDGRPQVQFVLAASSANENAGRVPIWVGLTRPSASGASVRYAVTGGTATRGQDYSIATGTLVFRRNAVATSITVNVLEDTRDEYNETVILSLSIPTTATLGSPATHTFTILDNDPPPPVGFARAASSVPESIGVARVPVLLTPPSEKTVTVNYATANGTALAGRDYRTSSGILTFGPLHTTATATVRILAIHQRGTHKTLQLTLTNPQNATLGTTRTHTLTILGETAIRRWPLYR